MKNTIADLKLSKNELIIMMVVVIATIVARGTNLFQLSYAVDDYQYMSNTSYGINLIREGRFGVALLAYFTELIDSPPPLSQTFYTLLYLTSFAWVGLIVCRIWKISQHFGLSLFVSLIITLHPYQAELFTFKVSAIFICAAIILAFLGFYISSNNKINLFYSVILVALSLSFYQIVLNYIFVSLCIAFLLALSRGFNNESANMEQTSSFVELTSKFITICGGTAVYLITNKVVLFCLNLKQYKRLHLIKFGEIPLRLSQLYQSASKTFFISEPVLPFSLKLILLILFCWVILRQLTAVPSRTVKCYFVFLLKFIPLCLITILGIYGVNLIVKDWWPVPRVLSAASFLWAGVTTMAFSSSYTTNIRLLFYGLMTIVIFGFILVNNHIFTDQLRINMRDIQKANRIVARLEANPEFSKIRRIAIDGSKWGFPLPILTNEGDMNMSAFGASISKLSILTEVSGYDFKKATLEDEKLAAEYCKATPKWPHPDSIIFNGELAIVCQ